MKVLQCVLVLVSIFSLVNSRYRVRRIVKGNDASEGQFSYIASLRCNLCRSLCSAVIIDVNWILTAGHCIHPERDLDMYTITVGTIANRQKGQTYAINATYVHPKFKSTPNITYNDIALIRLAKPLVFSKKISSVPFATIEDKSDLKVVAAGWGRAYPRDTEPKNYLQFLDFDTVESEKCQDLHAPVFNIIDGRKQICVTNSNGGSPCFGDSGGPLVDAKTRRLVGVFSGLENCFGTYPTVFTRVSAFVGWIQNVTQLEFPLS